MLNQQKKFEEFLETLPEYEGNNHESKFLPQYSKYTSQQAYDKFREFLHRCKQQQRDKKIKLLTLLQWVELKVLLMLARELATSQDWIDLEKFTDDTQLKKLAKINAGLENSLTYFETYLGIHKAFKHYSEIFNQFAPYTVNREYPRKRLIFLFLNYFNQQTAIIQIYWFPQIEKIESDYKTVELNYLLATFYYRKINLLGDLHQQKTALNKTINYYQAFVKNHQIADRRIKVSLQRLGKIYELSGQSIKNPEQKCTYNQQAINYYEQSLAIKLANNSQNYQIYYNLALLYYNLDHSLANRKQSWDYFYKYLALHINNNKRLDYHPPAIRFLERIYEDYYIKLDRNTQKIWTEQGTWLGLFAALQNFLKENSPRNLNLYHSQRVEQGFIHYFQQRLILPDQSQDYYLECNHQNFENCDKYFITLFFTTLTKAISNKQSVILDFSNTIFTELALLSFIQLIYQSQQLTEIRLSNCNIGQFIDNEKKLSKLLKKIKIDCLLNNELPKIVINANQAWIVEDLRTHFNTIKKNNNSNNKKIIEIELKSFKKQLLFKSVSKKIDQKNNNNDSVNNHSILP